MTYMMFGSTNTRHWKKLQEIILNCPSISNSKTYTTFRHAARCLPLKNVYWGNIPHLKTSQWHHTVNKTQSVASTWLAAFFQWRGTTVVPICMGTFWMGKAIMQKRAPNHLSCQTNGEECRSRAPACLLFLVVMVTLFGQAHSAHVHWAPCCHHHLWSMGPWCKCQSQDAVTLLRDTALTNPPLTEMLTYFPTISFSLIFYFNNLTVFQVNLKREKNECKSSFEGLLCHWCISLTGEKRNDQLTLCFWHNNLNHSWIPFIETRYCLFFYISKED